MTKRINLLIIVALFFVSGIYMMLPQRDEYNIATSIEQASLFGSSCSVENTDLPVGIVCSFSCGYGTARTLKSAPSGKSAQKFMCRSNENCKETYDGVGGENCTGG